jgi:DNA-binding response OmpR family regulator
VVVAKQGCEKLRPGALAHGNMQGPDCGAADYLTKPFDFRELLARLRALRRRGHLPVTPAVLTIGPLSLDTRARAARRPRSRDPLSRIACWRY